MASKRNKTLREGPVYINMGLDGKMLLRMRTPIRRRIESLYRDLYRDLPKPPLGQFIGFLCDLGADAVTPAAKSRRAAKAA